MTSYYIPSMSCGHCTAAIENAIKAIDPTASVLCEVASHTVSVESFLTDRAVSGAIRDAGYEVVAPPPS